MKGKLILLPVLWILTLTGAYVIGSKNQDSSSGSTANSSASSQLNRSSSSLSDRSETTSRLHMTAATRLVKDLPPTEAVAELAKLTDPLERSRGFLALIDHLGPNDFENVVAAFRELGMTEERLSEYRLLLSAWTKEDPIAAIDYAQENIQGRFARETILATWAQNDVESALAWAEANHEGDGANSFLVGIIRGISSIDPTRAAELTETLPFSRERGRALGSVVRSLMQNGTEEAQEWATNVEDERLQASAIGYIANAMSRQDPEKAAEWLSSVDNTDAQRRAAEDVAQRFADTDIEKAKAWAESLDPAVLNRAAEGVVDRLVENDPIQAAEWLAQIGTNSEANLDGAIGELIRGSARSNPYLAATWIPGLQSRRDRERYYNRIFDSWIASDEAAARDFMNNNEIPSSIRERFSTN